MDRWVESDSESDSYCVSYRFQPPQTSGLSRPITQAEVHYKAYEKLKVGDPVQIYYLPYKPEVCRLMFQSYCLEDKQLRQEPKPLLYCQMYAILGDVSVCSTQLPFFCL